MGINCFEESLIRNQTLPESWKNRQTLDDLEIFLQKNWELRSVFYDDGLVASRQQFLTFLGQQSIRTHNYIGTIIFKGEKLNIFPKVFRRYSDDSETDLLSTQHLMYNLTKWIEFCTKIDYPFLSISADLTDSNSLEELFISLYVRYVRDALTRGLYYCYEDRREDCTAVRGRIDVTDYLTKKYPTGNASTFLCSFSSFEKDNALNRIIKYTCRILINRANRENQKIIRHILAKLNDVTDKQCFPHDCDSIRLSKLHRHYSIVLSMSKMFLLNQTGTYEMDDAESFCFLFPTEVLFEGFIGGYMQSVLGATAKVTLQASDASLFSDVIYAGQSYGKALRMRHDILVEHKTKGLFILDTKYKKTDRFDECDDISNLVNNEIHSSDIYQVSAYARIRQISDVYLLYPQYRFEDPEPSDVIGVSTTVEGTDPINIHLIRLPFVFEEYDNAQTKQLLSNVIEHIFS